MENATDAIILAGSVLLLIIALTVSISSFTTLKIQVEDIFSSRDKIQMATDDSGNFINYTRSTNNNDVRVVQTETIISAIRRMKKEDYSIYIIGLDLTNKPTLSKLKLADNEIINNNELFDYESVGITENTLKNAVKLSIGDGRYTHIYESNSIDTEKLNSNLMKEIFLATKGKKFKEYIGIYQDKTSEVVSEANKITYKIITFVQEN